MAERNVKVTLTADTTQYVESMERAKAVTNEVVELLRSFGVDEQNIGGAIVTTMNIVNGGMSEENIARIASEKIRHSLRSA